MFSRSSLCDKSQNREIEFCPECGRFIYYSSQQESKNGNVVHLKCGACMSSFEKDVTVRLSFKMGYPVAVQPITSIEDIGPGDLICYLRVVTLLKHMHYAIVMDSKDKEENPAEVTVVEFVPHFPLRWGRVSKCQRNIETDIVDKCAWVFRYMPLDCLSSPQVLKNAEEFVKLEPSQWQHQFNRRTDAQHLASWCKSWCMQPDLQKFIPSFLLQTLSQRLELVRNCPAILHTNLRMTDSSWSDYPLLNKCPSSCCEAPFNRSSLISANEILINLQCGACFTEFTMRNMTSEKQKLMSKYGKYEKESIGTLENIGESDILVFRRSFFYDHHSLVTRKTEDGVKVTEFFKEKIFGRGVVANIRERPTPLTESGIRDGKVKRFLPLDCLQRNVVLTKMEELKKANPPYRLDLFNCQTLCTFVKTGVMSRKMEYLRQLDLDPILWSIFEIFQRNRPTSFYLRNRKEERAEDQCNYSEVTAITNSLESQEYEEFVEVMMDSDDFITQDLIVSDACLN